MPSESWHSAFAGVTGRLARKSSRVSAFADHVPMHNLCVRVSCRSFAAVSSVAYLFPWHVLTLLDAKRHASSRPPSMRWISSTFRRSSDIYSHLRLHNRLSASSDSGRCQWVTGQHAQLPPMVNRTSTSRNKNHAEKHLPATRFQPQSPSCDNNGRSGTFARHPFRHLSARSDQVESPGRKELAQVQ